MGLSFHDEKSLEEAVGSLRFASDPISTADQEGRDEDIGVEGINDIELVDRSTLSHLSIHSKSAA